MAADALPPRFFDPTSLVEARPEPEAVLDASPIGYVVYWLGAGYVGAPGVPALRLWHVSRYDGGDQRWDARSGAPRVRT